MLLIKHRLWCGTVLVMVILSNSSLAQEMFQRGDADGNGELQLTDAVRILRYLFLGDPEPPCLDSADSDDNGMVQLTDAIRILNYLFLGGEPMAPPGPPPNPCDLDPTDDDDLSCKTLSSACLDNSRGVCCSFLHQTHEGHEGHCELLTREECESGGGTFAGEGTSCEEDCDDDGMPDVCQLDCNRNGIPDTCDVRDATSQDCDKNGVPDECEADCDSNGVTDACDIAAGRSQDCDLNDVPDSCDIKGGVVPDCDKNGVPDSCDIALCPEGTLGCMDCNQNGIPDSCDIAACPPDEPSCADCNRDGTIDRCAQCLIPGDLNGDLLVDREDELDFRSCLEGRCEEPRCECADLDSDGDIDIDDNTIFDSILIGLVRQKTMAIRDFEPKAGGPGTVVRIEGVGFGTDARPEDFCVVAMNVDSTTAIPFHVLEATDTEILAEVGGQDALDPKGPIMIARGTGRFVDLNPPEGVLIPQRAWVWRFEGGEIAAGRDLFTPVVPPCNSTVTGALVDNQLCLVLDKPCPKGTKLAVDCRAWDHTVSPAFGVDGYIPCLVMTTDMSVTQCAQAICNAIIQLYASQTPAVAINCTVSPHATIPGAVKLTVRYPDRPITWGRFSVTGPRIELEINQTPDPNDDYVTWGPTCCRARMVGLAPGASAQTVVLTNDTPGIPDGGDLLFAPFVSPWPANTTATMPTLNLSLPGDGSWVNFMVAGQFGRSSTKDKDAVIEVRAGSQEGPICCRFPLMVRVRKNGNTLTDDERNRYVQAILDLHAAGEYAVFQQIHSIAAGQAHGGPAFVPWHRAFVLEYERALQRQDRSVAAHYWVFNAPAPKIFHDDFMGANDAAGLVTGKLAGWTIEGLNPIQRATHNHQVAAVTTTDATILAAGDFATFRGMEGVPVHDSAHVWTGGWMGSVPTATRDPVFFMLHSNVERLYARWQSMGHHGNGPNEFSPQGSFVCGATTFRLGHHLNDTMWPWDGITGAGPCAGPSDNRPASAPGGALDPPAAPGFKLGPPAMPTIDDVIDYLGRQDPIQALGFCYDDTPYN